MGKYISKVVSSVVESLFNLVLRENINTVRWRNAVNESVAFIEKNAPQAQVFSKRGDLIDWAVDKLPLEGDVLEFGVFKGDSLNRMSKRLLSGSKLNKVYGFDAFEGLQEDWVGHRWGKGAFSTNGKLPKIQRNAELKVGWIQDTLPPFLEGMESNQIGLIHIDTDTYTPAKLILTLTKDVLQPGTLILFDDFFGYPGWKYGEYKAYKECLSDVDHCFLGFSNNQALVLIGKV
ncbi:class I SAM-dependent methyltransferase [Teredinibacter turnerae]|uniref:class I SAM-dependent methyltransferase n=1 Tax=Teredinibacter turnerae TaxID=2426 RepID=UPI0003800823|nr:class I SAM-dependent methyltransferase [Teredinibacter turnerae]